MRLEKMRDADAASPIELRQYRTITQEQFRQICFEENGPREPKYLLAYLHNAGIVFYQKGLFEDHIILDQGWALEAIYAVFNREKCYRLLRQQRGRFTRSLLELVVWQVYPKEEQELFLSMMQSCGVCFPLKRGDAELGVEPEYVAPDLLPEKAAIHEEVDKEWDSMQPFEEAIYDYPLLHQGLIRAIISRIGQDAGISATYWQGGVCVYETTTRSHALIEQEMGDGWTGRIRLQTQGSQAVELLEKISKLLEEEQAKIGLTPRNVSRRAQKWGAAFGATEIDEASIKEERRLESTNIGQVHALTATPIITGSATIGSPSIGQIHSLQAHTQYGRPPSPKPRYYVSYAWSDVGNDREAIVDQLCEEAEKRGTPILRDKKGLDFGDSITKFMKDIGKGDCVFVILSDKYLKSPFCMFELFEIWRNSRQDEEDFLKRCRVFTLDDAQIWDLMGRVRYATHWKAQHDEIDSAIRKLGASVLGERDFAQFKLMQDFVNHVGDILGMFANIVQPRSFEDLKKYGFDDPPETVTAG